MILNRLWRKTKNYSTISTIRTAKVFSLIALKTTYLFLYCRWDQGICTSTGRGWGGCNLDFATCSSRLLVPPETLNTKSYSWSSGLLSRSYWSKNLIRMGGRGIPTIFNLFYYFYKVFYGKSRWKTGVFRNYINTFFGHFIERSRYKRNNWSSWISMFLSLNNKYNLKVLWIHICKILPIKMKWITLVLGKIN